ncbi:MAG TPA: response regulator transcription factor [Candidatus Kapabacteria bacterium]|nr:response regulator transcription factor [Candidatus Kapabacteria bacterium]
MRILVIEDEIKVASFIQQGLAEQAYIVDVAHDGVEGERLARENPYDLAIIDVMLPRKSGFAVCKSIREFEDAMPIMMLTALDSTDDKVQGFDAGADDYLVKPFEFRELLARLRALLRRRTDLATGKDISVDDLHLDMRSNVVTRGGRRIDLTAREYALLEFLMRNRRRVVSRAEIAERVWETSFDSESNVIDVYISFLRRKIDKEFPNKLIHTVVGMGYVIREDQERVQ